MGTPADVFNIRASSIEHSNLPRRLGGRNSGDRCREHSKLSASKTCIVSGRGNQAQGAGAHCPSEEHSRGHGHREISQAGKPLHSKHSNGQNTCSQGWTNSMFATFRRTLRRDSDGSPQRMPSLHSQARPRQEASLPLGHGPIQRVLRNSSRNCGYDQERPEFVYFEIVGVKISTNATDSRRAEVCLPPKQSTG